ncbi:TetR/AcrR family transcriptional regulator [Candidatus Acetothermia bacterium]|nr:TetR/AcrR family transcriptional regulator [Candidatus Acetothermia bacterium]MBI3460874.1 TetR/AcrR family transcriptional regulator [Candidatus Acetothermia bacterium]MBI3661258.1 TetR/AcrR family transcriptional regulator [Candidatus Acetothermia bacterium]
MSGQQNQKEATRERILQAAEEVFAQHGYHDTLMDEVGQVARASKGGLYFHFPSKEALFYALMDRLAAKLLREVDEAMVGETDPVSKVQSALETALKALSRQRQLAKILLLQGYGLGSAFEKKRLEIYERFASVIREHLDHAVKDGSLLPIDTEVTAYAWVGALNELIVRWIHTGKPDPIKRSLPVLTTLFLQGVKAEAKTRTKRTK